MEGVEMTYDQVLVAFGLYERVLRERGAQPIEVPHSRCPTSSQEALNHALHMLEQMCDTRNFCKLTNFKWYLLELGFSPRLVLGKRWEKLMRWLGFVQAILWGIGIFTLDELKSHNR